MKYKNYYRVSNIQRDAILQEYLTSDLSCRELAERYGLKTNTISKWVQRYLNQNNVVSLQATVLSLSIFFLPPPVTRREAVLYSFLTMGTVPAVIQRTS